MEGVFYCKISYIRGIRKVPQCFLVLNNKQCLYISVMVRLSVSCVKHTWVKFWQKAVLTLVNFNTFLREKGIRLSTRSARDEKLRVPNNNTKELRLQCRDCHYNQFYVVAALFQTGEVFISQPSVVSSANYGAIFCIFKTSAYGGSLAKVTWALTK